MLDRSRKCPLHGAAVAGLALVLLHAVTVGAAGTPRIVNGLDTNNFPTTGALLYASGVPINADNAFLNCSGTLIGCRTFLTAAHCVSSDGNPSHYWIYLQNVGIVAVSSITSNPSYDPGLSGNDMAIIKLATDVTGIEPMAINSTHDLNAIGVGLSGTIVGFGLTLYNARDYGIKHYGAVQTANCVTSVTGGEGNDKLVCWDFATPVGPPGQDSDTCNGDSGGPLLMDFDGVTEVVGLTVSGSSPRCTPSDHSWDASVYYNAAWIQGQIGADSTATCGGIGPVGSSTATVFGASGVLSPSHPSDSLTVDVGTNPRVLRVTLNGQDYLFNPDLYVKAGTGASPTNYDCKADGLSVFGGCEILLPTPGTWSVFVLDALHAGQYQVTTTVFGGTPLSTSTPTAAALTATPTPTLSSPLNITPSATDTPTPQTPTAANAPTTTPAVAATSTATAPPTPAPTATASPALDHFTCYAVGASKGSVGFARRKGVSLTDVLGTSTVAVRRPKYLCAPTDKLGEDATAPTHPEHLEGYQIKPARRFVPRTNLLVIDQFNAAGLHVDAKRPAFLLVPSLKVPGGPTPPTPTAFTTDYFQCYIATVTRKTAKFVPVPGVTLADQLGAMTVDVKKPKLFCAPVDRNGENPTAPQHTGRFLCYQIAQVDAAKFAKRAGLFLNNQLGPTELKITKPALLCVPATVAP
jgi:hypothetical protein